MALVALGAHEMVKSKVYFVSFVSSFLLGMNDVVFVLCVGSVHGACNGNVEN